MKKTILFSITSILAIFLLAGLASATITVTGIQNTLSQNGGSFDINITNTNVTGSESITVAVADITDASGDRIWFTLDGSANTHTFNLAANASEIITVAYGLQSNFNAELGTTYSTTLSITHVSNSTLTLTDATFCGSTSNNGQLEISDLSISTISGFGDDESFWYLRDVIEIEVDVDNDGDGDVEKMDFEWAIYNTDGKEIMDGSESISDLDENDDTTVKFEIKLDEDIEDFDGEDAILYVKAFGDIDKHANETLDGEETCASESEEVDVVTGDDFVIVDEMRINNQRINDGGILSDQLFCGSDVTLTAEVWNIGEDDQDEVTIEIYSSELGLFQRIDADDIDAYDSYDLEFTFRLPEGLDTSKNYNIEYEVFDEDGDVFENDENDEATFNIYFKATGNCQTIAPTLNAQLVGEANSGSDIVVQATVTNSEDGQVVYTMSADGFEGWANSVSVNPQVISLGVGEQKTVEFTFKAKAEAQGDQSFNIEATEGGKTVLTQPASVTITKKALSGLSGSENLRLVGIIALNIIFVVLIIIVARKILRRR